MTQSQQSLVQQRDKAAVCRWRYKHSLTSLECKLRICIKDQTASRHRYSGSRCYKYFFDNHDEATTISIFPSFAVCELSQLFEIICTFPAIYIVPGWMLISSTTSIKNKQKGSENFDFEH